MKAKVYIAPWLDLPIMSPIDCDRMVVDLKAVTIRLKGPFCRGQVVLFVQGHCQGFMATVETA